MSEMHVLIVTALEVEFSAVVAHLEQRAERTISSGMILDETTFTAGGKQVAVTVIQIGPGNVGAALETERAITAVNPSYVLFVGIAGGIKDVQLGDVVAAEYVYQYESGKAAAEFLPRPRLNASSYAMIHAARSVARNRAWQSRIGLPNGQTLVRTPEAFVKPIAAGEKVVTSRESEALRLISKTYGDALALEMEGYGFLQALHAHQDLERIVIRGISDTLEGKSLSDEAGWQEIASATAAAFAFELLATTAVNRRIRQVEPERNPTIADDQFWVDLRKLAETLYPEGPEQGFLWSRSGGNPGFLDLRRPGRDVWFAALRLLRQGGGGSISATSLIEEMIDQHPNNPQLKRLKILCDA